MSKKNYQGQKKTGAGFGKSKGNTESDFLYREEGDESQIMSFTMEDFPNEEYDNEDDQELLFVLRRICASYKHVLTLEFRNFWSTLKHNLLLRRSLNSFVSYANKHRWNEYFRKGHEISKMNGKAETEVKLILKEISRDVLSIFYRIVNCEEENAQKATEFHCAKIILDEWLIDIPKLLDIIAIYGEKNEHIVKQIIKKAFEIQKEFEVDFDEMQDKLIKEFLDRSYKEILMLKKKDKLGSVSCDISDADIERKFELLATLLDTSKSTLDIIQYFPSAERDRLLLDDKLNLLMENLFYELIFAREEAWVMGKFRADLILLIDVVLESFVNFFVLFFNRMISVFADKNLLKQHIGKNMTTIWNRLVKDLGRVQSLGKKQGDNRYWYLIEYSSDRVDFSKLFSVAPADISETYQLFQIQVLSVIDERKRHIITYEENKKEFALKGDDEKQQQFASQDVPDIKFVENTKKEDLISLEEKQKRAQEFQKKQDEAEAKRIMEEQKQIDNKMNEKPEILTAYQKGAMKVNMKMSEQEEKEYRQKTLWLAMEYEDEPDDSYNHFQPSAGNRDKNEAADEDDNDADEGDEFDENGVKLKNKQVEEGYDDGYRRRNNTTNEGYQPKPRDRNNQKPDTYQQRQKYKTTYKPRVQDEQNAQQSSQQQPTQNNNAGGYQKKQLNPNSDSFRNNNQSNNPANPQSNQNYKNPYIKKQYNKEDGFSGSDDEKKQQRPNQNKNSGPFQSKSSKEQPQKQQQKNILKKKYAD